MGLSRNSLRSELTGNPHSNLGRNGRPPWTGLPFPVRDRRVLQQTSPSTVPVSPARAGVATARRRRRSATDRRKLDQENRSSTDRTSGSDESIPQRGYQTTNPVSAVVDALLERNALADVAKNLRTHLDHGLPRTVLADIIC